MGKTDILSLSLADYFSFYLNKKFALSAAKRCSECDLYRVSEVLSTCNMKSPRVVLALSFFFGHLGVDRFFLGTVKDIIIGVVKLVINFVACLLLLLGAVTMEADAVTGEPLLNISLLLGTIIWIPAEILTVVDIFLAFYNAHKHNEMMLYVIFNDASRWPKKEEEKPPVAVL